MNKNVRANLDYSRAWLFFCALLFLACIVTSAYTFVPFGYRVAHQDISGFILLLFSSFATLGSATLLFRALQASLGTKIDRNLKTYLVLFCAVVGLVAFLTLPTKSQDAYHSLALMQEYTTKGTNPYLVTPGILEDQSWAQYVWSWRDIPVIYGPIWVFVLAASVKLGGTLLGALLLMKLFLVGALIATACVLQKLFVHLKVPEGRSWLLIATFALNPLVIQTVLVDGHSDILVGLSVLASYYLIEKKAYGYALVCIAAGALLKYVTLLLLPLLLLRYIASRPSVKQLSVMVAACVGVGVAGFLLYLPFGGVMNTLAGLTKEITERGEFQYATFVSIVLINYTGLSLATCKILAVLSAVPAAVFYHKKPSPLTYSLPLIALLALGTPWFQPWYLLWVLPLLLIEMPYWMLLVLTLSASLLSPNYLFDVPVWSFLLAVVLVVYYKVLPSKAAQSGMGQLKRLVGRA